jgi:hypothetical protein
MPCQINYEDIKKGLQNKVTFLKEAIKARVHDMVIGYLEAPISFVMTGVSTITNLADNMKRLTSYIPKNADDIKNLLSNLGNNALSSANSILNSIMQQSLMQIINPLQQMVPNNANLAYELVKAFRQNQSVLTIPMDLRNLPQNLIKTVQTIPQDLAGIFCGGAQSLLGMSGTSFNFGALGNTVMMLKQANQKSLLSSIDSSLRINVTLPAIPGLNLPSVPNFGGEADLFNGSLGMEQLSPNGLMNQVHSIEQKILEPVTNFSSVVGQAGLVIPSTSTVGNIVGQVNLDNDMFINGKVGVGIPMPQQIVDNYNQIRDTLNTQTSNFDDMLGEFHESLQNKIHATSF